MTTYHDELHVTEIANRVIRCAAPECLKYTDKGAAYRGQWWPLCAEHRTEEVVGDLMDSTDDEDLELDAEPLSDPDEED